jgi:Domain of unknown function (DUF5665)
MDKTQPPKMTDKQRLEFAKQIEAMYEAARPGWRKLLTLSFLKGVATGFGVFLGGTIVVALVLWLLSGLGQIPFLRVISDKATHTLQRDESEAL